MSQVKENDPQPNQQNSTANNDDVSLGGEFLNLKTIRKQNQGEGGVNPETGDPRYNPYLIPPDRQICKEYSVRSLPSPSILDQ